MRQRRLRHGTTKGDAARPRAAGRAQQTIEQAEGFATDRVNRARGDAELGRLLERNAYVTRLRTFLDPEEMTVDPDFQVDHRLPEVERVIIGAVRPARLSLLSALIWAGAFLVATRRRWA